MQVARLIRDALKIPLRRDPIEGGIQQTELVFQSLFIHPFVSNFLNLPQVRLYDKKDTEVKKITSVKKKFAGYCLTRSLHRM
jgi:hypothetical protein